MIGDMTPDPSDAELDEKIRLYEEYGLWPDELRLAKALRACRARSKAKDAVIRVGRKLVRGYDQAIEHKVSWRSPLWRDFKETLAALDTEDG